MVENEFRLDDYHLVEAGLTGSGHKHYIGPRYICRFCGRDRSTATFKHKAHAIPEFLGNHALILNSECDDCNSHFGSTIEPHLEKYTRPFRALNGITNKARKTPKHRDEQIELLHMDRHTRNLTIKLRNDDSVKMDEDGKSVSWSMSREPFIPSLAHKALCKIAVSIASEHHLPLFEPTINWLNPRSEAGLRVVPTLVVETTTPGTQYRGCAYRLYLRNTNTFPHCLFWIAFGSYSLLTFVPTQLDRNPGVKLTSEIPFVPDQRSPELIEEFGPQTHEERDLSPDTLTTFPHRVQVHFEKMEQHGPPTS
ncbi:HNH endonuclease [Pseudomonas sp. OTU750018]|uniref:HNH endonuclease n=1 Tax=Pseudomonas sp. OTU750018 TaxID=2709708 RepID=UPI00141FD5EA